MKVKYFDLKNKRVFISGGGSGIGATIVEHFCEQNSEVYFIDIDIKASEKLIKNIKKKKLKIPNFIECNILDIRKLQNIIQLMMIGILLNKLMKNIGKIEWVSI